MALTVVVSVQTHEVEWVSDLLWGHGVVAIEELDDGSGTIRLRTSLGEVREEVIAALKDLPSGIRWTFETIDDRVIDTWREHVMAFDVGERFTVVPAWLPVEDRSDSKRLRLRIEPGSTFGMGDHPTTRGCLLLLEKRSCSGLTVLDVGCGSGILGIAALLLGAKVAHGVDISPASLEVSTRNARANGVEDSWSVSIEPLSVIDGPYDLVLANILAPVLIDLSDELDRLSNGRGEVIISGVLEERHDHVLAEYPRFHVVDKVVVDGWATLRLARR